tara:strand:- start:2073 stop:2330 length:258 start_codon:yes stop_codon:yes gene_type:complete
MFRINEYDGNESIEVKEEMDCMMYINKRDVEKILEVMNKFPNAESFALAHEASSGIGSVITLTIRTQVNELNGEFSVEISGVENW